MVPDTVITVLVQENLDIACSAIEKAAMERAIADVDEGFAQSYEARRRHREIRAGQPFWDPAAPPSTFTSVLPDALRIKPSGVQPHQALVYEDFSESSSTILCLSIPTGYRCFIIPATDRQPCQLHAVQSCRVVCPFAFARPNCIPS